MAMPTTRTYTVEEFEQILAQPESHDRNLELIDGVIVEKNMPTEEHALIVGIFLGELYIYARAKGIGLPGPEERFRVSGDVKNTRQPDVSLRLNPDAELTTKGATVSAPDVIVEVKSPDDSFDDLRDKARYYIANGARLVILVFPRPRIVEVYRPGVPSDILTIEDTLEGYDVLPEFSLPVAKLFVSKRNG
jgi:Uma2 family endonuclease